MNRRENQLMAAPVTTDPQTEKTRAAWRGLRNQVNEHPFLKGFAPAQLAKLTDYAIEKDFQEGQIILKEGESADRFYLITDGQVALETEGPKGRAMTVQSLDAGTVLGWSWMFPPYQWQFTARAAQPTTALFFYATSLRELFDADSVLGCKLMQRIAEVVIVRLQNTRTALLRACEMSACKQRGPCHSRSRGEAGQGDSAN